MAILSSQHHSFDVAFASEHGIEEAILIHHFQHWIRVNKRLRRNFIEGSTWTYQSYNEIAAHCPYLSYERVRYAIRSLVKKKILKVGKFNKRKGDNTLWFSFVEESQYVLEIPHTKPLPSDDVGKFTGVCENSQGSVKIPTALPDTKPDTKTNNQPPNPLKRGKADKPPLRGFGSFVKLKEGEYESFCQKYGTRKIDELLEEINDWIASGRGDPYEDYAAGIRTWIRKRKWDPLQPIEAPKPAPLPKLPENPRDLLVKKNQEWLDSLVIGQKSIRYFQRNDKIVIERDQVSFDTTPPLRVKFDDERFEEHVMTGFKWLSHNN